MPEKEFTITIPGINDVFRLNWPGRDATLTAAEKTEKVARTRERIRRMKAQKSPLPEIIQWIPDAITRIDDAQDMLTVALTIAKPLLRRVAPRFLPGLGWILLANDVLNVATWALGKFTNPLAIKGSVASTIKLLAFSRAARLGKVARFLTKTNWFSFGLQAAQVTENLFGVGLRLGPVMGAITDTVWGGIRALQGASIKILGPLSDDPLTKAGEYLMGAAANYLPPEMLSKDDIKILIGAQNVAIDFVKSERLPTDYAARLDQLQNFKHPVRQPWEPTTIEAFRLEGIDPTQVRVPFNYQGLPELKFGQMTTASMDAHTKWEAAIERRFRFDTDGTMLQFMSAEASLDLLRKVNGEGSKPKEVLALRPKIFLASIHHECIIPTTTTKAQLTLYFETVEAILETFNTTFVTKEICSAAVKAVYG